MVDKSVRHAPVINIKKIESDTGPLADENFHHALNNAYWVARLASGLELISRMISIEDAHEVAKDHLGNLVDPVSGLRAGIPDELRLRWKIASLKKPSQGGRNE